MANKDKYVVDISSDTQVLKLYKKKGRGARIFVLVLCIILFLTGTGFVGVNLYIETHRRYEGQYDYMSDGSSLDSGATSDSAAVTLKNSDGTPYTGLQPAHVQVVNSSAVFFKRQARFV